MTNEIAGPRRASRPAGARTPRLQFAEGHRKRRSTTLGPRPSKRAGGARTAEPAGQGAAAE